MQQKKEIVAQYRVFTVQSQSPYGAKWFATRLPAWSCRVVVAMSKLTGSQSPYGAK